MADFKLSSAGDLDFTAGAFSLVSDGAAIGQMIKIRIRHYYGEWFLDNRRGVRWYERIFVKQPDYAAIACAFRSVITETPGVVRLMAYSQEHDRATRVLTVAFQVETEDGTILSLSEVLQR
jgi:hypothetical protein